MPNIQQATAHCPCQASYAQRSFNASQTQLAAINTSRSLDLDIVTEEGDKVTLSMDAKASALYASHAQVEGDEDGFSAKQSEVSFGSYEREVSFSVEGDLNARERREIRKVIKTVNRMMRNFVKGKVEPMMDKAAKLEGLQTIDSLELNMEYERNVVVARQSEATVGYDRYGAAKASPAAVAPKPETAPAAIAAKPETAPAVVTAKSESAPAAVMMKSKATSEMTATAFSLETESRLLAGKMAEEVTSARAPMANVLEGVDRMLRTYRNMAMQWNPLGGQIMDQVKDLFDAAMGQSGAFQSADAAVTEKADD